MPTNGSRTPRGRAPRLFRGGAIALVLAGIALGALSLRQDLPACTRTRGVPTQGLYVGAAVGGNDDPAAFEAAVGRLALRRTYWAAQDLEGALVAARSDLQAGRLPWLSFKFPLPWQRMARGDGDEWAKQVAAGVRDLPGPAWVAFHHEPEGDGDVQQWRAAQERVGPILREVAPNAAYTVVLTGWNQFHGPEEFGLDRLWPHTTVDVAGFDVYDEPELAANSARDRMDDYLHRISAWARQANVSWALAETGYDRSAHGPDQGWITWLGDRVRGHGGVGLVYFNSDVNSRLDWRLDQPQELADFATALRDSQRPPASCPSAR